MTKEEYIEKVNKKYTYLKYEDIEDIYETAKLELFTILYACDSDMVNENTQIPYIYQMKVLDCMYEIIDLGTMRNFTSYQENGVSWNRPISGYKSYENILGYGVII